MFDWHAQVYHEPSNNKYPENWNEIRKQVIDRDKKCYRCETKQRRHLTVHHLLPRSEGGADEPTNLVTLCATCHDIVEVAHCRSLLDIDNTIEKVEALAVKKGGELSQDQEDTFPRPEWHKWVYGGQRRTT